MNTTPEKPPGEEGLGAESGATSEQPPSPPTANFSQLRVAADSPKADGPKDEALAALEAELTELKDARVEERFLWIVACVVLIDVIWFSNSPNPVFPIVILVLELVALIILGRRMGVEEASRLLERILQGIGQKGQGA